MTRHGSRPPHPDRRSLRRMLAPRPARAASVTDGAGRAVPSRPGSSGCFRPARRRRSSSIRWRPSCCSAGRAPTVRRSASSCCPTSVAAGGRPHHRPRQYRQSGGRAGAQAGPHPRRRQLTSHLRVARRPRPAADRHSVCAARWPLRRYRRGLSHARRADRAAATRRGPRGYADETIKT